MDLPITRHLAVGEPNRCVLHSQELRARASAGVTEFPTHPSENQTEPGLPRGIRWNPCKSGERLCHNGISVLFIPTRNKKGLL